MDSSCGSHFLNLTLPITDHPLKVILLLNQLLVERMILVEGVSMITEHRSLHVKLSISNKNNFVLFLRELQNWSGAAQSLPGAPGLILWYLNINIAL